MRQKDTLAVAAPQLLDFEGLTFELQEGSKGSRFGYVLIIIAPQKTQDMWLLA